MWPPIQPQTHTHTQPDIHTSRPTHTNTGHSGTDCPCYPFVSSVVLSKTHHSVVCRFLISVFCLALEDIFHFQRHRIRVTPFSLSFTNGRKSRHGLDPETTCGSWVKAGWHDALLQKWRFCSAVLFCWWFKRFSWVILIILNFCISSGL